MGSIEPLDEIHLLPLNDDGSPNVRGEYIYLVPKAMGSIILRFAIQRHASLRKHRSLWVNINEEGKEFQRDKFREFKLEIDVHGILEIDIVIDRPGSFAFYTTYTDPAEFIGLNTESVKWRKTPLYFINVAPRLTLKGRHLPLANLSVLTVISKCMGKDASRWQDHLRGIGERGYNMVHFTPLQHRGSSNSPYSIYDHLTWDPISFPNGEQDIEMLLRSMECEYGLLGLTDVVWNHAADNSAWLQEHPEAGYNLSTAPWLQSALELDDALLAFGKRLSELDLPTAICNEEEFHKIVTSIRPHVIENMRLVEFYVIDAERDVNAAIEAWTSREVRKQLGNLKRAAAGSLELLKEASSKDCVQFLIDKAIMGTDRMGERFRRRVDPEMGATLVDVICGNYEEQKSGSAKTEVRHRLRRIINEVNMVLCQEYEKDVSIILEQISSRIRYLRLDGHGPKLGPVNDRYPLIESYFAKFPQNNSTQRQNMGDRSLVKNGWIWAANSLVDIAGPFSRAYLRREIIVWHDTVKLRYGSSYDDSPFLWGLMTEYTRVMARNFHGFRIDNAHSTPIHVAEFLLDEARKVRPNLFVVAELFTGSEEMDYAFVKPLGINALIREAMQARNVGELVKELHRYSGHPIGSFERDSDQWKVARGLTKGQNTRSEVIYRVKHTSVQALVMDCTHDNESPAQKRDARDTLPNAALVSMCAMPIGSVMGYDEIYPELIDIVHETRFYTSTSSVNTVRIGSGNGGIGGLKKLLNKIHDRMGRAGYDECHICHQNQYVTIHRLQPQTGRGYFLIAHMAYPGHENNAGHNFFNPIHLAGTKARHLGSWTLEVDASDTAKMLVRDDRKYLQGLPSQIKDILGTTMESKSDETIISILKDFSPGSIALFETWIPAVEDHTSLGAFLTSGAEAVFAETDMVDLDFILYQSEEEERSSSNGEHGLYVIPGHGKLIYAGIQGWWNLVRGIMQENDLAHPLCQHLRNGEWALDYIVGRLERISEERERSHLSTSAIWFRERFDAIRKLPKFLLPRYFALVIRTAYFGAKERSLQLTNKNVREPLYLELDEKRMPMNATKGFQHITERLACDKTDLVNRSKQE